MRRIADAASAIHGFSAFSSPPSERNRWHTACTSGPQEVHMTPMIDSMLIPGLATTMISVGPAVVGIGIALIAGLAWVVRETNEELRRIAVREFEARRSRRDVAEQPALAA
jgi:hypothetical protein